MSSREGVAFGLARDTDQLDSSSLLFSSMEFLKAFAEMHISSLLWFLMVCPRTLSPEADL